MNSATIKNAYSGVYKILGKILFDSLMGKLFMIKAVLVVTKFEASYVIISSRIYTGLQGPVL
jgi:hypothetical protein